MAPWVFRLLSLAAAGIFIGAVSGCAASLSPHHGDRRVEEPSPRVTLGHPSEAHRLDAPFLTAAVPKTATGSIMAEQTSPAVRVAGEELWIVPVPEKPRRAAQLGGELLVTGSGGTHVQVLPTKTAVTATLQGPVATVEFLQEFPPPQATAFDAVYAHPLPQGAIPTEFLLTVGDRKIRAVICERARATTLFNAAKARGLPATLGTADELFTLALANLPAGKSLSVRSVYVQLVAYGEGQAKFELPPARGEASLAVAIDCPGHVQDLLSSYPLDRLSGKQYLGTHKLDPSRAFTVSYSLNDVQPPVTWLTHDDSRGRFQAISVWAPPKQDVHGLVLSADGLEPVRLPPVQAGRSILVVWRIDKSTGTRPLLRYQAGKDTQVIVLGEQQCPALPAIWATARRAGLLEVNRAPEVAAMRKKLALDYGLLTDDTAVIAIDTAR